MKRLGHWLTALCLLGLVVAWAVPSGASVPPGYEPQVKLLNPQDYQNDLGNHSGKAASANGEVSAKQAKSGGFWGWMGDHGMGLVKGIGAGLIGAGIVVAAAAVLIGAGAPLLLMAGAAIIGGAIYGAIVGSARFNWNEAIIGSVIGGVSAGVGSWIAGSASPVIARAGVALTNMVSGGVASLSSYLIQESHPTWGGAATAFGIGAGTAALFMAGGAVVSKGLNWAKGAMGFGGAAKSAPKSAVVEAAAPDEPLSVGPPTAKPLREPIPVPGGVRVFHTSSDDEAAALIGDLVGEPTPGRFNYLARTAKELPNFEPGYEIHSGSLRGDMVLVQLHSDAPLGAGRSAKYWTTTNQANKFTTIEEYLEELALIPEWGPRTQISVARIPAGSKVTYVAGHAAMQNSQLASRPFPGQGLQMLFPEFDPSWIVVTKSVR